MTHVRTSPYYPQSNGKIERWHKTIKVECIRPGVPLSLDQTRAMVARYVNYYNDVRLHSAIGYVPPRAVLEGRAEAIQAERQRRLAEAREARKSHARESVAVREPERQTTEAHAFEMVAPAQAANSIALSQ